MNTLISILMAMVLNFLGIHIQESRCTAQSQATGSIEHTKMADAEISEATIRINCSSIKNPEQIQVKNEHKCKLSK